MPKFHLLKVKDIRRETKEAVSVAFEVPEDLREDYQFIQGQYLTIRKEIEGEEIRRSYSVCVSPLEKELRVAIKKVYKGRFSTFANDQLKVGDVLDVMTPMGRFYTKIEKGQKKNYACFAGGSGITPVISIIKTVLQTESESRVILFYANKGVDSIIFLEQLEALKNKYLDRLTLHHIFSEEKLESELFNGYITPQKTRDFTKLLFNINEIDEYFVCGPEPMMLAIREGLESLKVASKKIHIELFAPIGKKIKHTAKPEEINFDPTTTSKATIRLDGDSFEMLLDYGGESVLDAALNAGADLPFACKGGVCATCRAKLVEGEVKMDVNYGLEQDEVDAGFILTCQSHPRTDRIVVDFDIK